MEQRAPHYLRSEGTGEDASVASSLKQQSEIFLTELPDGGTELRMKVKVDVLGRLGSFGLSVMKTKADRMWEEFGQNLVARLEGGPLVAAAPVTAPAAAVQPPALRLPCGLDCGARRDRHPQPPGGRRAAAGGRGSSMAAPADGRHIRIELQRGDTLLKVDWPVEAAADCSAWLRDVTK